MAAGDYAPGTRLVPVMVNITFDEDLVLAHVGIGYHLVMPSGRLHEGGFTWHSPRGDYARGPDEHMDRLQAVMNELLAAAAAHEGVELRRPTDSSPSGPGPS